MHRARIARDACSPRAISQICYLRLIAKAPGSGRGRYRKIKQNRIAASPPLRAGKKPLREMDHEIGHRHLARADEGGDAAEQAQRDQRAAHHFDDAPAASISGGSRAHAHRTMGKPISLTRPCSRNSSADHDASDAQDQRRVFVEKAHDGPPSLVVGGKPSRERRRRLVAQRRPDTSPASGWNSRR